MKKRTLFIVLVLVAVLTLGIACQSEEQTPEETTQNESTDAVDETTSEEATVEDTEEPVDDNTKEPEEKTTSTDQGHVTLIGAEGSYPLADAVDLFHENFQDTPLSKIQLDKDFGNYVYKIEGFSNGTEYELKVDVESGEIVEQTSEAEDGEQTFAYKDAMPIADVYDILMNNVAADEWILDEWELGYDSDILVYEFELDHVSDGRDIEVKIDALSGEVIEIDE